MRTALGIFELDQVKDTKMCQILSSETAIQEIQDVLSLVRPGDSFVDCGAFIGVFTIPAATRGANVVAIEPNPVSRTRLQKNLELNNISSVRIETCGVGNEVAEAALQANPTNASNTMLVKGHGIKLDTLDNLISSADFIKIDVEGMEPDALAGARRILSKKPTIYLEVFEAMLKKQGHTVSSIKLAGYSFYVHYKGAWYSVPNILCALTVLNPGRLVGRGGFVLNVLATTHTPSFPYHSFLSLFLKKCKSIVFHKS